MPALKRKLTTETEFLALPESNQKVELLDGEVHMSPSPQWWHQEVLSRITQALRQWADQRPFTVVQSPADVRFGPSRILQPDAFVIAGSLDRDHVGPIEQLPLVCIEVLSGDRIYDRVTKRLVYAGAGVPEYWVVEPAGLVERWSGPGLSAAEELVDQLRTPLLPGLQLDLPTIFG